MGDSLELDDLTEIFAKLGKKLCAVEMKAGDGSQLSCRSHLQMYSVLA
jgi:hypothetical protein